METITQLISMYPFCFISILIIITVVMGVGWAETTIDREDDRKMEWMDERSNLVMRMKSPTIYGSER